MRRPTYDAPMRADSDEASRQDPPTRLGQDELTAPRTQIVTDREAYLGQGGHDVGRRISEDQVELFVTADVASALQMEFARVMPEFVALHDVGVSASLRLLGSLAGAAKANVQRLTVRRQGHGVALATLQFVEMVLSDGTHVRVYSTDLDADSQTRTKAAQIMLAYSRLGVLMVGAVPATALSAQLAPLHEALRRGPWPNRDLLMVPLGSSTALAAQASALAGTSSVAVHVTPHAAKPKQAWSFISGAWNRLNSTPAGARALQTEMALAVAPPVIPASHAPTDLMDLPPAPPEKPDPDFPPTIQQVGFGKAPGADRQPPRSIGAAAAPATYGTPVSPQFSPATAPSFAAPLQPSISPPIAAPRPMPAPGGTSWQGYVDRCAQIKGTASCCVFDMHTMQPLASTGTSPTPERLAQQGTALLNGMNEATRALGLGGGRADATITAAGHHLLLRPVPGHPGIAVHLVLVASNSNLTLARMQLERINPEFSSPIGQN
jgi:hypothetical protein